MSKQPHFSSCRLDWQTPKVAYQVLDAEFCFDCDPCFVKTGQIHPRDMLGSDWGSCNFVNPPYGNEIPKWIKKGYEEWKKGKTVVFLIPSRTDTRWWHDYIMKADEIRFIKGRLKFDDGENPAPFPSCIAIFKGGVK